MKAGKLNSAVQEANKFEKISHPRNSEILGKQTVYG